MAFSKAIKDDVLVRSARHCCVCRRATGLKIEVHHIVPQKEGGEDTLDNAIALCLDCHADAGHYFAGHPKGIRLSPEELKKHRIEWFRIVAEGKVGAAKDSVASLSVTNKNFDGTIRPVFVKIVTQYENRDEHKKLFELMGKDPMDVLRSLGQLPQTPYGYPLINRIQSYDDLLDFISDDKYEKALLQNNSCQPIAHRLGAFRQYKEINLSNGELHLTLTNNGPDVFEDYKVYLTLENVVCADVVSKRENALDTFAYRYNIVFHHPHKGEFVPARKVLVQGDSIAFDGICFRPDYVAKEIILNWKLFARNLQAQGSLHFPLDVIFEEKQRRKFITETNVPEASIQVVPKIDID